MSATYVRRHGVRMLISEALMLAVYQGGSGTEGAAQALAAERDLQRSSGESTWATQDAALRAVRARGLLCWEPTLRGKEPPEPPALTLKGVERLMSVAFGHPELGQPLVDVFASLLQQEAELTAQARRAS